MSVSNLCWIIIFIYLGGVVWVVSKKMQDNLKKLAIFLIFFAALAITFYLYFTNSLAEKFLNSNFFTSFFGASCGSAVILLIAWKKKKELTLSSINAAIGELSNLANTILIVKSQYVAPTTKKYNRNLEIVSKIEALRKKYGEFDKNPHVLDLYLSQFPCPDLSWDLKTENIYSEINHITDVVAILAQTKRAVKEIPKAFNLWDEQIKKIRDEITSSPESTIRYYLGTWTHPNSRETTFGDTLRNLGTAVDDGLYFIHLSIEKIQALAESELPFWLKKRVIRIQIDDAEHRLLIPPPNYKKGWRKFD